MHRFRTARFVAIVCLALAGSAMAEPARAELPKFINESVFSPNAAVVKQVVESIATDIVILNGGLEQGMRIGAVCRIDRGLRSIGEVIIVESRTDRAAGLILNLEKNQVIRAGDVARVKTFQS